MDLSEAETSVDFSWHPDEEDTAYYPNLATDSLASLPLDFLQTPLPLGLGFSSECSIWLDKFGIKTWDEFVSHSTTYTVHSMMSTLSVPVYYKHRKDLRRFYVFGIFHQSYGQTTYPTVETSSTWIPHFTGLLRTYWRHFADTESLSHRMVTGNSPTQPTQQPVVSHTPRIVKPQPYLSLSVQDLPPVPPAFVSPPQLDALVTVPDVHSNGGITSC